MVVSDIVPGFIRVFGLLLIVMIIFFLRVKAIDKKKLAAFIFLTTISLMITLIYNDNIYKISILILGGIVTGFFISCIIPYDDFVSVYTNIILVVAIFSLITFFLDLFFPEIFSSFKTVGMRETREVKNLLLSVVLKHAEFKRNYGFFWEPGAFQTFLSLSLYLELFCKKNTSVTRVVIIVISIITTFSTTGYFCLIIIAISYAIEKHKILEEDNLEIIRKSKKIRKYIFCSFLLLALIFFSLPEKYTGLVFDKLSGVSTREKVAFTTEVRVNAIIYPLEAFLNSPLMGIGYDNFNILSETKCNGMPTFTILNWLSLYGLFFGGMCVFGYISFINFRKVKGITKYLIVISFILMISTESYISNPYIYLLIFYGISKGKLEESNLV